MSTTEKPQPSHYERLTAEIRDLKARRRESGREYRAQLRALRRLRRQGPGMEE